MEAIDLWNKSMPHEWRLLPASFFTVLLLHYVHAEWLFWKSFNIMLQANYDGVCVCFIELLSMFNPDVISQREDETSLQPR